MALVLETGVVVFRLLQTLPAASPIRWLVARRHRRTTEVMASRRERDRGRAAHRVCVYSWMKDTCTCLRSTRHARHYRAASSAAPLCTSSVALFRRRLPSPPPTSPPWAAAPICPLFPCSATTISIAAAAHLPCLPAVHRPAAAVRKSPCPSRLHCSPAPTPRSAAP